MRKEKNDIRAVIFDLGRVLIDFDHRIAAKRIAHYADKDPQAIFKLFFNSRLTQLFEKGKISAADFFRKVKKILGLEIDFKEFLTIWNEIFFLTPENKQVYKLAKSLRKNYKIALLSNVNEPHFNYLKKKFPVFSVFHHVILSYKLGCIKPETIIYKKAIKALKVLPEQIFYVDDRPELVACANKLGIRGFVYKGILQLKKDLVACGIKLGHEDK